MVELCYPAIVTNNERIDETAIPHFVNCINKLNAAVAYMQGIS